MNKKSLNGFLLWFQSEFPDARIWRNNRGAYKIGNRFVRYGFPPAQGKGKDELKGSDYISFHKINFYWLGENENTCVPKFWEYKSLTDKLAEGQINFLNMMTEIGAECFIVLETKDTPYFKIEMWEIK